MLVNNASDEGGSRQGTGAAFFETTTRAGAPSAVRLAEGSRFPRHAHHGAEEVVVLSGTVSIGGVLMNEGDYMFTSPGEEHDVLAITDAVIFVSSQKATPSSSLNDSSE